ncbi:MAG TPA: hypothetical protein VJ673_10825 [Aromatoleum sp.]|uniref:hypothetical protein n=1 Tax=Aromatoleum sp. TaxID=2307007 RepID=UPI002B468556|nr:hypothetical protein [Aromatoleum sp.]HJV26174.1 hypothetical protein [Aromatoleum sp.]
MQQRIERSRKIVRAMAIGACLLAAGTIPGGIAGLVASDMTARDSTTLVASFQPESLHSPQSGLDSFWNYWR